MRYQSAECDFDLRMDGRIEFNRDFTDVVRVSSGGLFRLEAVESGVRRELRIEPNGNGVSREYRLNGRVQPFDAQAQAWFAEFLIALDRRTALGVDVRLPRLLEQGGVDAVLAETARMTGDFARDRYYQKLGEARRLSPAETAAVLSQVASATRSDHYASAALSRAAAGRIDDGQVRAAAFRVIEGLKSDHYIATSLKTVLGTDAPTAAEQEFLVRVLARVRSDHYKYEVLASVVRTGRADVPALLRAMDGIGSGHYQHQAIVAVVGLDNVDESDLLALTERATRIRGDHYESESLRAIVRHRAATDRVRDAVRTAASTLSRHYREQVERAAGR